MSSFSIIPQELFSEETANLFLPISSSKQKRVHTSYEKFEEIAVVCLFDENLRDSINPLLSLLREDYKESVIIHIEEKKMYIVVKSNNKLLMANMFDISKEEDSIYYTLLAIESTQIKPQEISLKIIKNTSAFPTLEEKLKRYIEGI